MNWEEFKTRTKGFLNDLIEEIGRSVGNLADFWMDFYHEVIHPRRGLRADAR